MGVCASKFDEVVELVDVEIDNIVIAFEKDCARELLQSFCVIVISLPIGHVLVRVSDIALNAGVYIAEFEVRAPSTVHHHRGAGAEIQFRPGADGDVVDMQRGTARCVECQDDRIRLAGGQRAWRLPAPDIWCVVALGGLQLAAWELAHDGVPVAPAADDEFQEIIRVVVRQNGHVKVMVDLCAHAK